MKACPTCKNEYAGGEVFCPIDGSRLFSPSTIEAAAPAPVANADPLVGRIFDKYKILRRIGEGGMGIVYEAMHVVIEKHVAFKILRDDFSSRPDVVERFRQEAKSASRIGHEHIVDISDFGETPEGQSYFVMEMLEGCDLAEVLAKEHTLLPKRAARILIQCCRALGAAHAKGIVHRDMKPENIFLVRREGEPDFVKIVDFGIAKMSDIETTGAPGRKLTKTGMIFGTPEYMSPEQAAGKALDHRVDVYALGVIMYEMLAGRVPFVGDTFMGVLTQHMFEQAPPIRSVNPHAKVSPEVEAVIHKAMAKDLTQRYQTPDELAKALQDAMDLTGDGIALSGTMVGFAEPIKPRAATPVDQAPVRVAANTVLEFGGGEEAKAPAPKSSKLPVVLGLAFLAVAVLGGGGAYLALRRSDGPGMIGTAPQGDGSPGVDPNGTVPGHDPRGVLPGAEPEDSGVALGLGASQDGDDAGTPNGVASDSFAVASTPPGAQVFLEGRGKVCDATPCTVQAVAGSTVRLSFSLGAMMGSKTFIVGSAPGVSVSLARPRTRPQPRPSEDPTHGQLKNPFGFH